MGIADSNSRTDGKSRRTCCAIAIHADPGIKTFHGNSSGAVQSDGRVVLRQDPGGTGTRRPHPESSGAGNDLSHMLCSTCFASSRKDRHIADRKLNIGITTACLIAQIKDRPGGIGRFIGNTDPGIRTGSHICTCFNGNSSVVDPQCAVVQDHGRGIGSGFQADIAAVKRDGAVFIPDGVFPVRSSHINTDSIPEGNHSAGSIDQTVFIGSRSIHRNVRKCHNTFVFAAAHIVDRAMVGVKTQCDTVFTGASYGNVSIVEQGSGSGPHIGFNAGCNSTPTAQTHAIPDRQSSGFFIDHRPAASGSAVSGSHGHSIPDRGGSGILDPVRKTGNRTGNIFFRFSQSERSIVYDGIGSGRRTAINIADSYIGPIKIQRGGFPHGQSGIIHSNGGVIDGKRSAVHRHFLCEKNKTFGSGSGGRSVQSHRSGIHLQLCGQSSGDLGSGAFSVGKSSIFVVHPHSSSAGDIHIIQRGIPGYSQIMQSVCSTCQSCCTH